jgi:hypothetical protein
LPFFVGFYTDIGDEFSRTRIKRDLAVRVWDSKAWDTMDIEPAGAEKTDILHALLRRLPGYILWPESMNFMRMKRHPDFLNVQHAKKFRSIAMFEFKRYGVRA